MRDCGQVINPDGVKKQIEGSVVQTPSRTLGGQMRSRGVPGEPAAAIVLFTPAKVQGAIRNA